MLSTRLKLSSGTMPSTKSDMSQKLISINSALRCTILAGCTVFLLPFSFTLHQNSSKSNWKISWTF